MKILVGISGGVDSAYAAKQLLSEGQKKISAIAEECGFSSTYHFCRSFKERVGTTPSEFRSQNTISLL